MVSTTGSVHRHKYSRPTTSGHTKVILPHEEAVKAPFPPGCKVLCFDENGFRVGVVRDVLVFISLHEEATYGTYYDVEMKGANMQERRTSVFTASDLRLTPDSPVEVSAEYFGSVFDSAGPNVGGSIQGTVLGSFEIPPTMCSQCDERVGEGGNPCQRTGKFFYSVRVRFPGMNEAVEAHGVPPEHVTVLPSISDNHTMSSSVATESIIMGGVSYDLGNDKRNRHTRNRSRRITPEDMPHDENEFHKSAVDGYYQEQLTESINDLYHHKNSPTKSIRDIISNPEASLYDDGSESEFGWPSQGRGQEQSLPKSSPPDSPRDQEVQLQYSNGDRERSTRTTIRRNASNRSHKSDHDHQPAVTQMQRSPPRQRASPARQRLPTNMSSKRTDESYTDDYDHYKDMNHQRRDHQRDYQRDHQINPDEAYIMEPNHDATSDESYGNEFAESEPDMIASKEEEDVDELEEVLSEEKVENMNDYHDHHYNNHRRSQSSSTPSPSSHRSNINRAEEEAVDDEYENYSQPSSNRSRSVAGASTNGGNSAESRSSTPSRKKAFGKTWSRSNQNEVQEPSTAEIGSIIKSATPKRSPLRSRGNTPVRVRSVTPAPLSQINTPTSIPEEGCYLLFDASSGGRFIIQYSRIVVKDAIGFWCPGEGKTLQGFKFKQNQGRSDLMKGIAGKDYKKKYFSGWCQFVKAALAMDGYVVKYSENERIEVDLYVFYPDSCGIEAIEDGKLYDVSKIGAVACLAKGNNTFDGVKTGEYGTFVGKGAAAGASLGLI
mmetsp:Transcript_6828/g.7422  ORF Transcript_6828/g.7422 Transcript_6828/m.7422 type:complete len:774 (-) Transcript_6828:103-2424(-)